MVSNDTAPDTVVVNVPSDLEVSTICGLKDKYPVELDANGKRTVCLPVAEARALIGSAGPSSLPWRQSNPQLAFGKQQEEPGIHVASMLRAARENAPRSIFDRGGIANDVLRALGVKL